MNRGTFIIECAHSFCIKNIYAYSIFTKDSM